MTCAGPGGTAPGPQPGTGKPGNCPPEIFANMMPFTYLTWKVFLETALPLRELLLKTTLTHTCCVILDKTINQSMYHASENSQHRIGDKLWGASCEVKPVPSPRGVWWAYPPKESSKPPDIEIWNVINQCNFCQLWMSTTLLHKRKDPAQTQSPPIDDFLATVLRETIRMMKVTLWL